MVSKTRPCALRRYFCIALAVSSALPYSSLDPRGDYRLSLEGLHRAYASQPFSEFHAGSTTGSPRLCLRWLHHPRHGVLSVRRQAVYRPGAHYVRSGDFVINLIRESQDLDEYAFSLGALAHYAADNDGHRLAVNVAVPMLYPELRSKFGSRVTYADDALSHMKTEFGFDVLQVAQGHYAPDSYREFIGFEVSRPVLERAFQDTYGLKLEDVFKSVSLAIGSYRHTVSSTIPNLTRVAWQMKKSDIVRDTPSVTKRKFLFNLSRASYRKKWGKEYQEPGFGSRILAWVIGILPKIGKARALQFKVPTQDVEKLFLESFNSTLDRYRALLKAVQARQLILPNDNFDVGEPTGAGKYQLSDRAYAQLLDKLSGHYPDTPPEVRADILAYYGDLSAPISTKADTGQWAKLVKELAELKAGAASQSAASGTP